MWMQWFGVKLNFGHRGKIEAKTGGANWGGKKNNWGGICTPLPPRSAAAERSYMYTFAGTAIAGLYCVPCILCMWNTRVQTSCLACVPAPSIRVSYGPSVLH